MRYRWKWCLIITAIQSYWARVVIYDDIGMLKRMQQSTGSTPKYKGMAQSPGNSRQFRPAANQKPTPNGQARSKAPIKVHIPTTLLSHPSTRSMPGKLGNRAPIQPKPTTTAPYNRIMPSHFHKPKPLNPNNRPKINPGSRISYAPAAPSRKPNTNNDYAPPTPVQPPKYVEPSSSNRNHIYPDASSDTENWPASISEDLPRSSTVTIVSYVSSTSSKSIRIPGRSSIHLNSSALNSINTVIPNNSLPSTTSLITDIPDRVDIDDKRLNEFANDHDDNIDHANTARKSFLSMKIEEVKNAIKRDEAKISSLQKIHDEYSKKMDKLKNEITQAKTDIGMYRALVNNNNNEIERLDSELKENETDRRLEDAELLRLNKELNEVKNKIELLKEKTAMMRSRLKQMNSAKKDGTSKLQSNENKLGMYIQLAGDLKSELDEVREGIDEVEATRRKEQDTLNKLEIEYNQYENDRHLPLFVRYT